jgi:tetratricopeptide (TPR) repeat protein
MVSRRIPNNMLRDLLVEANWTGDALARTINALGAEAGIPLRYQRFSVSHWLSGVRPRPPVPDLVAEAFSRRLGRVIPVSATGLAEPKSPSQSDGVARWWERDVVARLIEPPAMGPKESTTQAAHLYSLRDLSVPSWAEVTGIRPDLSQTRKSVTKVERSHVRSAARMIQLFSDADFAFGGGHTRPALASYLAAVIAPWLRADAKPVVRRELLTVASRLAYLCGFMWFDDELHGTAQRYYLTSLRLAGEAGDATGYAVTLRALSNQARLLGHRRQAVDLAETAVAAASSTAGSQTYALLFGQLGVAHAADGNRRDALRHLLTAERHLARAVDAPEPIGGCDPASLAHQEAAVRAELGDRSGAIQALTASIRHRSVGERRSRAITHARLAELQLDNGDLEAACGTWQRFVQDYPHLQSHRVDSALAAMRARIRPHQNNSAVIALRRHMATLGIGTRRSPAHTR